MPGYNVLNPTPAGPSIILINYPFSKPWGQFSAPRLSRLSRAYPSPEITNERGRERRARSSRIRLRPCRGIKRVCVCARCVESDRCGGAEKSERSWENDCPLSRGRSWAIVGNETVGSPFCREGRTSLHELAKLTFVFYDLEIQSFFFLRDFALNSIRIARL